MIFRLLILSCNFDALNRRAGLCRSQQVIRAGLCRSQQVIRAGLCRSQQMIKEIFVTDLWSSPQQNAVLLPFIQFYINITFK